MADETKGASVVDLIKALAPMELLSEDAARDLLAVVEADRDLACDHPSLGAELADHPRRALRWSLLAAGAERYIADLELEVRVLRAQLDARTREALTAASAKFTEAMITAAIESDPLYRECLKALHAARAHAHLCTEMPGLLRLRHELLLAAGARQQADAAACRERQPITLSEAARLAPNGRAAAANTRTPIK